MRRSFRNILIAVSTTFFVCISGGRAFSDTLSLGALSRIYAPLAFTHDKHMEIESNCAACHHYTREGDTPACSACHGTATQPPKKQIAVGLKDAYHGLCIGCHKRMSGPVDCGECHAKKKGLDLIYLKALSKVYQPVRFSHGYHIGLVKSCPSCHHHSEADRTPSCGSCHDNMTVYRYLGADRKTGLGLKAAYHGLCVGCHEKGRGPVACGSCHAGKAEKR